jgi:hypothetical protein
MTWKFVTIFPSFEMMKPVPNMSPEAVLP